MDEQDQEQVQIVTLEARPLPQVGDRVWYFAFGTPGGEFPPGVARAATITEVDNPGDPESSIGVAVLNPTGLFFNRGTPFGPGKPGHWSWPERYWQLPEQLATAPGIKLEVVEYLRVGEQVLIRFKPVERTQPQEEQEEQKDQ